jgi:transcriptional regulator with XRE-family HTH domain
MALTGTVSSPQALGRLLQQARLAQGLSQQEVAAQLGISQGYVSELEGGKTSLALTRIFDIMRLTGMTLHAEIPEGPTDA